MKRSHLLPLAFCAVLSIATGVASMQTVTQPTQPTTPVVEGARTVVTSDRGIAPLLPSMFEPLTTGGLLDGLSIINQPYAATFESETIQNAGDGTSHLRRVVTKVWRDSQGRTRREQLVYPTGANPSPTDAATSVVIFDPVSKWGYAVNHQTRTAQKHRLPESFLLGTLFDNQVPLLVKILRQDNPAAGTAPQQFTLAAPLALPLGIQTINGVAATGRRVTMRVPGGAMGNTNPVDAVYETWIAPDLQLLVKGTATNPVSGSHTFQLKTISRTAPAATLFQVPAGYAVTEMGVRRTDLPPPNAQPQPTATTTPAQ